MEAWQVWQEMARESEKGAWAAEGAGCLRSAASRFYYAAYQSVTALLLYRGQIPPAGFEAWSHFLTPTLLKEKLRPLIASRDRRNDLAGRLRELYDIRLIADYTGSRAMTAFQVEKCRRDAGFILGVADNILPRRQTP